MPATFERTAMSFWDVMWFIFVAYLFIAYLMVLFSVIADIFRNRDSGGFIKALWVIALIFVPFITVFIYVIANSGGMAERESRARRDVRQAQEEYIQQVAGGTSAVDQLTKAKRLVDAGAISTAEYESLKARVLA
jgi:ABC-type multidrug transport system fused ATPase/permease subunit